MRLSTIALIVTFALGMPLASVVSQAGRWRRGRRLRGIAADRRRMLYEPA
jgi:hypothetical protein